MRVALTFRQSDLLYYPFVSITWVGALARESGAKSPCKWGSDSDICSRASSGGQPQLCYTRFFKKPGVFQHLFPKIHRRGYFSTEIGAVAQLSFCNSPVFFCFFFVLAAEDRRFLPAPLLNFEVYSRKLKILEVYYDKEKQVMV